MPGSRLPAFCTSMGRVLLAALPDAEIAELLTQRPPMARTSFTVTNPADLMAMIADVRAKGFAVIDQEVELGLRSIAVPILNARGRVAAAINLGLPALAEEAASLKQRYLPALLAVQAELRKVLR